MNNGFDQPGAEAVYDFCFSRGVPLTVVSRMAVPILPMQLAKSFAVRTHCPVMTYLADAQFLGLEGLWQKLCDGKLPARCTKQWYFETFCGVGADDFAQRGYASLHKDDNINQMLNGFVKPYDGARDGPRARRAAPTPLTRRRREGALRAPVRRRSAPRAQ